MHTTEPKANLLIVQLGYQDTHFILEAWRMLEEKWLHINQTTTDEDEQAEYGMDGIVVHHLRLSLLTQGIEAFGPAITNFSREPFG